MGFTYPDFLFALAVLAIPVLIHLFSFRRYIRIRFSNVRFLKEINREQDNRRKLKHYLVLASRLLALAALVLAFAKPLSDQASAAKAGKTAISVYIDNSLSMDGKGSEGLVLEAAKEKARAIVRSHQRSADFQILSNDNNAGSSRFVQAAAALAAIDQIKLSAVLLEPAQAWNHQLRSLSEYSSSPGMLFQISDFRKRNLPAYTALKPIEKHKAVLIPVSGSAAPNISIDSAWLTAPAVLKNSPAVLGIRMKNYGEQAAEKVPLRLKIAGQPAAITAVDIPARGSATTELQFSTQLSGAQPAVLETDRDQTGYDDRYYLSFNIRGAIPVSMDFGGSSNTYVRQLADNSLYQLTANGFSPQAEALFAGGNAEFSGQRGKQIADYIASGGTVLLFPPDGPRVPGWKTWMESNGFPVPDELSANAAEMEAPDLRNPFFSSMFTRMPQNLQSPEVRKYYTFISGALPATALLKLRNGDPLVQEIPMEKGRLFLFSAAPDDAWGNFHKSTFFPLVFNGAMAGGNRADITATTGSSKPYRLYPFRKQNDELFSLRSDSLRITMECGGTDNEPLLFHKGSVATAGNFTLNREKGDDLLQYISFNTPRSESDPTPAGSEELEQLAAKLGAELISKSGDRLQNAVAGVSDSGDWKWFILLSLIFGLTEILLLKLLKN